MILDDKLSKSLRDIKKAGYMKREIIKTNNYNRVTIPSDTSNIITCFLPYVERPHQSKSINIWDYKNNANERIASLYL